MAFLYFDPLSKDFEAVRDRAKERGDRVSFGVTGDELLAQGLQKFAGGEITWLDIQVVCQIILGLHLEVQKIDPRIARVMERLRDGPAEAWRAADWALDCSLSETRFQHLFREAAGLPYRRYRLWCRLAAALRCAHSGASLTEAAHAAGFASSAHLSTAFRNMFGLSPSQLNIRGLGFLEVKTPADPRIPTKNTKMFPCATTVESGPGLQVSEPKLLKALRSRSPPVR